MNLSSFLSGSIFFILVAPQLEREPINYHEVDSVHTFQTLFADAYIAVYNLFYTSQPVLALACFDQDVNPKGALKVFISVTFIYVHFVLHGLFSSIPTCISLGGNLCFSTTVSLPSPLFKGSSPPWSSS